MTQATDAAKSDITDVLGQTIDETGQLQTVLDRTIQALNNRGVQVLIDFDGMIQTLRLHLDQAQKTGQDVSTQLNQLQELVHTSALITSSLDLNRVLEEVMDTVIKLTGAERAYLMLRQHDGELKVQAARNWDQQTINNDEVTFSHGILQTAIDGREPIVTTNAQADERFSDLKSVFSHDLRSMIVVPLILQDNVVGVLYADNRIEQGVFSQDNVPLLTAFANQAAIAISNARLFEKVKEDLNEARAEVARLKIEIDQGRLQEKVTEITDTDYFQYLTEKAKDLRERSTRRAEGVTEDETPKKGKKK